MSQQHDFKNLASALTNLSPKSKVPASARVLNAWITQAQDRLDSSGPRLGWIVAATVVCAAIQRVVDESGRPCFLLKGGTMLQYRLPGMSRTTQDIDGLVRGDIDRFLGDLDAVLSKPWGPLTFIRGKVEVINVPYRIIKPRRFDVKVQLKGVTWRRVQIEISPDEGRAGTSLEEIPAPSLAGFGLPSPDQLASLSLAYQIAQKVHASTDPHDPPQLINDRARDVVDLLLLRDLVNTTGNPTLKNIHEAIKDVFASRAKEAVSTGMTPRTWPTTVKPYPHWEISFAQAAQSAGLSISLAEAVNELNKWLKLVTTQSS